LVSTAALLSCCWASIQTNTQDATEAKQLESTHDNIQDITQPKDGKFYFGRISTLSHTMVSFTTSTVLSLCLQATVATPICGGKKRKRRNLLDDVNERESSQLALDSSVVSATDEDDVDKEKFLKFFTVWTKSITTTTLTTFFTNTGTTISLSYLCTSSALRLPIDGCN